MMNSHESEIATDGILNATACFYDYL